jgi:hypothetical protein
MGIIKPIYLMSGKSPSGINVVIPVRPFSITLFKVTVNSFGF